MTTETSNRPTVDELIAQGALQQSRKYRRVFIPPSTDMDCLAWLRVNKPDVYDYLVEEALNELRGRARSYVYQHDYGSKGIELTPAEFDEFREKTKGKKPWTPEGKEQCSDCGSLGHMHRRGCVNEP